MKIDTHMVHIKHMYSWSMKIVQKYKFLHSTHVRKCNGIKYNVCWLLQEMRYELNFEWEILEYTVYITGYTFL